MQRHLNIWLASEDMEKLDKVRGPETRYGFAKRRLTEIVRAETRTEIRAEKDGGRNEGRENSNGIGKLENGARRNSEESSPPDDFDPFE